MSEYLVKAHWVTSAAGYLQLHHQTDVVERVRETLPADVRRSFAELEPIQWCPRSYHTAVLNAIAGVKKTEPAVFEDLLTYGQYVAAQRLDGPLRPLMHIVTLKLFAKALPTLWARDHEDPSRLEVDIAQLDEGRLPLFIRGATGYDHAGVAMLGWVKQGISRLVRRPVHVKQRGWSLSRPAPDELSCEVTWS